MKKRIFSNIIAVLAVMVFAASAFGEAFQVDLNTSVPNIPKSKCYQAGTISLKFDGGTTMMNGDVIQFTLNNGVQLCRNIEFFYGVDAGVPGDDTTDPPTPASADVGFLVKGTANSLIVTMTLGTLVNGEFNTDDDVTFTVPVADPPAPYTMSLFDEKITSVTLNGVAGVPILKKNADGDFAEPIIYADNVICIDTLTFDYQGERVEVTPDSIPMDAANKLSFTGEREIARILAADDYALVPCKEAAQVGNIPLGEGQEGCPPFDFEDPDTYCTGTHYGNQVIIQALSNPFPKGIYTVTLEVKVNGLTGDQGVYIYGDKVEYATSDGLIKDICDLTKLSTANLVSFSAPGACGQDTNVEPGGTGCVVDCANKVVKATSSTQNVEDGVSALTITEDNQSYLKLDLPAFRYDNTIVKDGDVVSVNVTVAQYPCGNIISQDIVIGTFGCTAETKATTLLYPYFTPANGTYFWSAYAITNISGAEGTITLYMYESDGDAFEGVVGTPVAPHSIWLTRVDDSIVNPDITWTQIAGTGTPGDAPLYIKAETTFTSDGFGFIAGSPTGESMGYLPRNSQLYTEVVKHED